jgi:hypothetical protein
MTIQSICNFISYQMGEYHSIFPSAASVLHHIFFTIGNGYEMDEETQSPIGIGDRYPIHLFPDFNKEEMTKEMMPRWGEKVEKRAEEKEEWELELEKIYKKVGKERKDNWNKEAFIEGELAKYVFPEITPDDLSVDSLYQQLVNEEDNPMRTEHGGGDEYKYVRPYPLSDRYSKVYLLSSKSPECVRGVALNFCTAWLNYLNKELGAGRVHKVGTSYSDEQWTTKHRDMLYQLVIGLTAGINSHRNQ